MKNQNRLSTIICAVGVCVVFYPSHAISFNPIGDLVGGQIASVANGVSGDGTVAVGGSERNAPSVPNNNNNTPVLWTYSGGLTALGSEVNRYGEAFGASGDGRIVVGRSHVGDNPPFQPYQPFRWNSSDGLVEMGHLFGGGNAGIANDASVDGSIIVGWTDSANSASGEAFRWTESGGFQSLGDLPGGNFISKAEAVSADGTKVAGYSQSALDREAFVWVETNSLEPGDGVMVPLGALPTTPPTSQFSQAESISSTGNAVVGMSRTDAGDHAVLWTGSDLTWMIAEDLGPGFAYDVSGDGSIVVGSSGEAFIWDALHGKRSLKDVLENNFNLDLTGWTLSRASGISDDGTVIVGEGRDPSGNLSGWVVSGYSVPESGETGLLLLSGLLLIYLARNSRDILKTQN